MTEARLFDRTKLLKYRRTVFRELTGLGMKAGTSIFGAAEVMAAVSGFGTSLTVLTEVTGHSPKFIRTVLKRLRKSGVLRGTTLRVRWDVEGFEALCAISCDALVAEGFALRVPDEKRSAAHRGKHSGPRKPRTRKTFVSGPFTPKKVKSNPLYIAAEHVR